MKKLKDVLQENKVSLLADLKPNDIFYFISEEDEKPFILKVHHVEKNEDGSCTIYPYIKCDGKLTYDEADNGSGKNDGFYFTVDAECVNQARTFEPYEMDYIIGVDLEAFIKTVNEQYDWIHTIDSSDLEDWSR